VGDGGTGRPFEVIAVAKAAKCELCNREVEGARLCASCAEMVKRVSSARDRIEHRDQVEPQGESLQEKADRAQAKAQGLTPIVLG
jgi:hypothetical protein